MDSLKKNIAQFKSLLHGTGIKLIAVSKTQPVSALQAAYQEGVRIFGENKVQEMAAKYEALPKDIEWHMIGHLQTNKVKVIAPFVAMIHSVDSLKLLQEINKRAEQNGRVISCLLQVHIAEEETKFGLSEAELFALLRDPQLLQLQHVCIKGLMGMATNSPNEDKVRREFWKLKDLFNQIGSEFEGDNLDFSELSMGMSNDFHLAMKEGTTMIRIGSLLFGERD